MNTTCPQPEEWLRLLDGEATENRATELRAHATACSACARQLESERRLLQDLAAPVPVSANAVANVMRRLAQAESRTPLRVGHSARTWALAGGVLAAAAVVLVLVLPAQPKRDLDGPVFSARGSGPSSWAQKVGMELWTLEETPRKIANASVLDVGKPIVGSYHNLDKAPAFALAFALDARGDVHWIYPGFEDARTDPQAVRLEPLQVHRALPDSVVLDALAPGPIQLVTIVSVQPLRVSRIESLPAAQRNPASLRTQFPGARIDALSLRVTGTKDNP